MDLSTIKARLAEIAFETAHLTRGGASLGNLDAFKAAVEKLAPLPPLRHLVAQIKSTPIYSTTQDDISFADSPTAEGFKELGDGLVMGALFLRQALESTLPAIPPQSVVVTLPSDHSLDAVAKVMSDLEAALGHLVKNETVGGDLKVASWETGSLVVTLTVNAAAAVLVIVGALRAAAATYQAIQKGRLIGQAVVTYKIKNESLRDVQQAQEQLLKELVEREGAALERQIFESTDPERLARVQRSIKILADLLDKGTRIRPALEMSDEEKETFPDIEKLVVSPIKELTTGDNQKPIGS